MKKTLYTFLLFISVFMIKAQESPRPDFKNMSQQERREYIKSLSPEQRRKLMEDAAAMMAIRNLQIPVEKQDAFKKLLSEYSQSQRAIKEKFKPNKARNQELSDAEAKQMIDQSFEVGLQLLNNRKLYTEKFLKILSPQQVLKLFDHEGQIREKMMERREKMGPPPGRGPSIDVQ